MCVYASKLLHCYNVCIEFLLALVKLKQSNKQCRVKWVSCGAALTEWMTDSINYWLTEWVAGSLTVTDSLASSEGEITWWREFKQDIFAPVYLPT